MSLPMTASSALTAQEHEGKASSLSAFRYLCFGGFQLDTQRELLFKDGAKVRLPGKVFQTLLALLEKPGEVLTREALRERLWPEGTFVNYDANVNTTVNKLRLVLGDSPDQPAYIETIPRLGYCFVGSVERLSELPKVSPSPRNGNAAKAVLAHESNLASRVERLQSADAALAALQQTAATNFWSSARNKGWAVVVLLCGVLIGMGTVLLLHRI